MKKYSRFIKRGIAILFFLCGGIIIITIIQEKLVTKQIVQASNITMPDDKIIELAKKRIEECQTGDQWKCLEEDFKKDYWEEIYLDSCGKSSIHPSFWDLVAIDDPCFTISSKMFFIKTLDKKNLLEGIKFLFDIRYTLVDIGFINNGRYITIITHTIEIKNNYQRREVNYYIRKREINKHTKELTTTGDIIKEKRRYIE